MSVTGQQVANEARKLKPGIFGLGTIPYVLGGENPKTGLDCQGLIEYIHRQCGMQMSYKGTNDMWRNMLSEKGTIEEAVARHGSIPVGALVFICNYGAVPNGYSDTPDCEHVYIKIADGELLHASASNGKVITRKFSDKAIPNGGPTNYGLVTDVDYGVDNTGDYVDNAVGNKPVVEQKSRWKPRFSHLRFQQGDKGGGTREIQTGLRRLGYAVAVDGAFGPLTEAAVIEFQEKHGLEPDGVVGKNTWAALIKAVNV